MRKSTAKRKSNCVLKKMKKDVSGKIMSYYKDVEYTSLENTCCIVHFGCDQADQNRVRRARN